jgi:hypothetical protein
MLKLSYARGYVGDPGGEYNGVVTGQNLKIIVLKKN